LTSWSGRRGGHIALWTKVVRMLEVERFFTSIAGAGVDLDLLKDLFA
jgi:hypothetical protein